MISQEAWANNRGVSFIELLITITIISVVGVMTTPFLSSFISRNNFATSRDRLISTLRKGQHYSMDGKNNIIWAACTNSGQIRLYRGGTCASPTFSENFTIPSTVTVSSFDITFSRFRGEPPAATTITISGGGSSSSVVVNAAGAIDIN